MKEIKRFAQKLKNKSDKKADELGEIKKTAIIFRCTLAEKEQIKANAKECNLQVGYFVRQLALGFKPQSLNLVQERITLRNHAADLGRLGGLLKLLLTDKTTSKAIGIKKINHLLQRILESQKLLNKAAYEVILG